jgi:hypothetical protein
MCFIDQGDSSVSIKTIAEIAGVNHGLDHHFSFKRLNPFIV